jgi:hypothetical protein
MRLCQVGRIARLGARCAPVGRTYQNDNGIMEQHASAHAAGPGRIGLKRIGKTLIVAASLLLAACSANEEGKAKELVTEFYQTHASNRPSGALTLKELITFRRFLSVPLFDLLKDVSVAQEAARRSPRPKWRPILMPIPCRRWCKVTSSRAS